MSQSTTAFDVLYPPAWLGVVGGGQLGRMFCQAAQRTGYQVAVLDPDPQSPTGQIAHKHFCAAYDDEQARSEERRVGKERRIGSVATRSNKIGMWLFVLTVHVVAD